MSMATLAQLARACITAATQEGDKVRANAARALGHIISAADFNAPLPPTPDLSAAAAAERPGAWLPEVIQALMSCLTTGNAKVQWNACHATGALFRNPTTAAEASSWSPLVMRMLLMLTRDTRNFKIRMHAAATLAVPGKREEFGNAYPDTVSIIANALEGLDGASDGGGDGGGRGAGAGGGGGGGGDDTSIMDLKYKPQLGAQLTTTLLRVLAMGTVEDAGAVRDTLVRKQGVLRRALEASKAALEEAASLDAALPEDPFGVSTGAAKAKGAAEGSRGGRDDDGGGGGGGNGFGVDQNHEDTAVGGSGAGSSPLRTPSLDMSSLAKALSPARRGGGSGRGDGAAEGEEEEEEGGTMRRADVAAAASGLARMYGALGAGTEELAAFYGGMAEEW